ncbi:S9 family peptidase [Salegentibacter sp. Hel_I_6]|uniref:alpha/beta hydrolase family protein n=1 Tax=Salegentibacter sp. Hel_I_6 TaxID=1250278 RepID=UPI0005692B02|nr:alpha/beta hydrolase [Salegentibacter sp. Hel_I_6]
MKIAQNIFIGFFFISISLFAQEKNYTEDTLSINQFTEGNLVTPKTAQKPPLVIFIQGSGGTNRDGNQNSLKSDFAKKIAYELAREEIASFRFDKRSIKAKELNLKTISFDDLVFDVESILSYFNEKDNFSNLVFAGHSQGSLIGMLVAKGNADAFISIAGPGKSIDHILADQLSAQLPQLKNDIEKSLQEIKKNGSSTDYPKNFENIFHPRNQPFLHSWMKYDPAEEIAKLEIPALIINGTNDSQVKEEQAELLHTAAKNSELVLLEDMNHVFRKVSSNDLTKNYQTYNNAELPLHPEIIPVLTDFIKNLENK